LLFETFDSLIDSWFVNSFAIPFIANILSQYSKLKDQRRVLLFWKKIIRVICCFGLLESFFIFSLFEIAYIVLYWIVPQASWCFCSTVQQFKLIKQGNTNEVSFLQQINTMLKICIPFLPKFFFFQNPELYPVKQPKCGVWTKCKESPKALPDWMRILWGVINVSKTNSYKTSINIKIKSKNSVLY